MRVFINGQASEISGELKLQDVLDRFSLPSKRIAIELNRQVIRRREWEQTDLKEGDRIEIVHFVGGG